MEISKTSNSNVEDEMRLAIMQPYFFPYIGYFQLIATVDLFIVYDNIKYTKKGWINRNRILQNGKEAMFSLPLKKNSDFLDVRERELTSDFNRDKLLNQLKGAYQRAPYFAQTYPLLERTLRYNDANLFNFLHHSIVNICEHLGIATTIERSSDVAINHALKNQDKVIALCEAVGAKIYVNAIGGMDLYTKNVFSDENIDLKFIRSKEFEYPQYGSSFVPWLSIIDVMMFNSKDEISSYLSEGYELV